MYGHEPPVRVFLFGDSARRRLVMALVFMTLYIRFPFRRHMTYVAECHGVKSLGRVREVCTRHISSRRSRDSTSIKIEFSI
jgi:hypothetical protein